MISGPKKLIISSLDPSCDVEKCEKNAFKPLKYYCVGMNGRNLQMDSLKT